MSPRPAQQQTLSDIALRLNASLDLTKILRDTIMAASLLADTAGAIILLPDAQSQRLTRYAHYNHRYDIAADNEEVHFPIDEAVIGQVFRDGQRFLMSDRDTTPIDAFAPIPIEHPILTLLYIPMVSRRGVVGVLGVYDTQDEISFSRYHFKVLEQLGSHAAVAIENARTYADSQARAYELAVIMDTSEAVNSTLALSEVLALITKSFLQAVKVNLCEIYAVDSAQQQFQKIATQTDAIWKIERAPQLDAEPQQVLRSALQSSPQLAHIQTTQDRVTLWVSPSYSLVDGIAALTLLNKPEPDVAALIQRLPSVTQQILEALSIDNTQQALSLAHQLLRSSDATCFEIWREANGQLYQLLKVGSDVWSDQSPHRIAMSDMPEMKRLARGLLAQGYSWNQALLPEDIRQWMQQHAFSMVHIIPFQIQGDQRGIVLLADTTRLSRFSNRELSLIQTLVVQAANAIKNARLFSDLQNSLHELRQTQAKLVQSARLSAIGELAAVIAHQINNPLTTILGDTEMLLEDYPNDGDLTVSLQAVNRAGNRAYEVVRRLLSVARQKSDDVQPELMDINATIENTLTLVEATLLRAGIKMEVALDEQLPFAQGLPGQLEDVWLNLLLNARDALRGQDKPHIAIQSQMDSNGFVKITVRDNGEGLQNMDQIFDAFYSTKAPDEGTGLGLYICANIVQRCGGKIIPSNVAQGGAQFDILLPTQEG